MGIFGALGTCTGAVSAVALSDTVEAAAEGVGTVLVFVGIVEGCVASVSEPLSTGVRVPGVAGRDGMAEKGGRSKLVRLGDGGSGVGGRL